MIDIKAIKAAAEAMHPTDNMTLKAITVSSLCDEIERLRVDAARYQWIRRCMPYSTIEKITLKVGYKNDEVDTELDAAIDAAMEEKQ